VRQPLLALLGLYIQEGGGRTKAVPIALAAAPHTCCLRLLSLSLSHAQALRRSPVRGETSPPPPPRLLEVLIPSTSPLPLLDQEGEIVTEPYVWTTRRHRPLRCWSERIAERLHRAALK